MSNGGRKALGVAVICGVFGLLIAATPWAQESRIGNAVANLVLIAGLLAVAFFGVTLICPKRTERN